MKTENEMWGELSQKISHKKNEEIAKKQRIIVGIVWIVCVLIISTTTDGNSIIGILGMIITTVGLLFVAVTMPWGKSYTPTEEEIKSLAKEEVDNINAAALAGRRKMPQLKEILKN